MVLHLTPSSTDTNSPILVLAFPLRVWTTAGLGRRERRCCRRRRKLCGVVRGLL